MLDVRTFYAVADLLVAPSLEDSFNLPVLEAMSCGLPVVVSHIKYSLTKEQPQAQMLKELEAGMII